jgi:hypothetical protein
MPMPLNSQLADLRRSCCQTFVVQAMCLSFFCGLVMELFPKVVITKAQVSLDLLVENRASVTAPRRLLVSSSTRSVPTLPKDPTMSRAYC